MAQVLVVTSALADLRLAGSVLARESLEVVHAADSRAALGAIARRAPDLLVVGPGLSKSDLSSLLTATRPSAESEEGPVSQRRMLASGTRVVMLSTIAEVAPLALLDDRFIEIDAFLEWPADPAELSSTISWVLDLSGRRSPRINVHLQAHLEGLSGGSEPVVVGTVLNLSDGGTRVASPSRLTVGAEGAVSFTLPGVGGRVALACAVRAVVDQARLHYGLEFTDADSDDLARLTLYVEHGLGDD